MDESLTFELAFKSLCHKFSNGAEQLLSRLLAYLLSGADDATSGW